MPGVCPDFAIKRHDTKPPFKVLIEDCDGPVDLTDLVVEANMWAKAKLKKAITAADTYFQLADEIGFDQIMIGDIIIMDRVRMPEHMLVTAFDEINKFVQVQRGYNNTTASPWKKGNAMRIMKIMNGAAESQMILEDKTNVDGTIDKNILTESFLIYEWKSADVCLPGCYYLEFKVLKMLAPPESASLSATGTVIPSFIEGLTPEDYGCITGLGVEWSRRYPVNGEGYLIQIQDSPTVELG